MPLSATTLATTDPELVAVVDRFAAEDVPRDAPLDARPRALVRLAALVATGGTAALRVELDDALAAGVTPVELKELLYQAVPYVGLGRAVDVLVVANELLADHEVELPLPGQATVTRATRATDGLAVQKRIVDADVVDAMYANAPADEQHVQRYLSAHCFGDHYTRGGLDVPTRELLTLAMLVALGGADPQVAGHVRANLNVGNDRATLLAVLTQLLPVVGYPRTLNALRALDDVAPPTPEEES
ncbi:carboxymuconolactone decarboxylase family protein [Krasilnikoviella flava]|uniref:4-carboxymuconolactone decarboxylase n=1 Tax=Krasilnikoviella flava TaxID=526729 RepID=A0A1T5IT94_9MICO|nr:carboxymuconolactone decarboxylase family protein [Krasilnikoviella flava]SKC42369.1 4-carboxymuconolactone decarboxylase [Krasilnikoviella flava]